MKSLLRWALVMLPWAAGTVLAQSDAGTSSSSPLDILNQIPDCAVSCVTTAFLGSGCGLDNIASCVCTNVTLLNDMSGCVQTSCEWQDQLQLSYATDDLCHAYPYSSRGLEIKLVVALLAVVTFPIIALRLLSRWMIAGKLELDDWTTLATAGILAATFGCVIASAKLGFGLHYWNVNPANAQRILQLYYAVQMLYIVVLILAKVSIVALYARVFPDRKFQIFNKLVLAFLVLHGLVFVFVIMFECAPIASIWDRTLERKCVDLNAVAMSSAILSIAEDVVILAMPMHQLSSLQLGLKKKLAVCFMFSLGSFACITSIIRLRWLILFAESFDTTWDNVDVVTWSMTEISVAMICGSLPALRPLFKKIPGFLTTIRGSTVEIKETHDRGSSHLAFRDKGAMPHSPTAPGMVIIHISNQNDPRMKPLPPTPLQPLYYHPPWRDSDGPPRTLTPSNARTPARTDVESGDYEMDLRNGVGAKPWM
ncbi:integral membrane protein [Colletotrichum musicola]|uniref:Integral membrane protein n=1 Tax=Colletotrichum musicola TaxID=2175873 RepID=A0A8H6JZN9_9PEZI|nr:integral membrane protein [Colletotrichum musicola]